MNAFWNMLTMAVAVHGQSIPDKTEPKELYDKFMAYRRLGQYIVTGNV